MKIIDSINEETNTFKNELENINNKIKVDLNVTSPTLLKTGAMSNLINLITHAKLDNKVYLNQLVKQINPATADTFSSLSFHATLNGHQIEFSKPSTYNIQFILNEVDFTSAFKDELFKYTIVPNTVITSSNGFDFQVTELIEIILNANGASGKVYGENGIRELEVIRTSNPLDSNGSVFLINYDNLKQIKRTFYLFDLFDSTNSISEKVTNSFSIDLDITNINEIHCWKRDRTEFEKNGNFYLNSKDGVSKNDDTDDIEDLYNLTKLDIKYNNFGSNSSSNDIFLDITSDNQLLFTAGNGINGKESYNNEYILVEIKTTVGSAANSPYVKTDDFTFKNTKREIISTYDSSLKTTTTSDIKAIALQGGEGGSDMETIEQLQNNIMNKISSRNNLVTYNDYMNHYTKNNIKPFIDVKYFNSSNNYFVYNVFKYQNTIMKTVTKTLTENELKEASVFYPTISYNGISLFSPFYYKKNRNDYNAYSVLTNITIDLDSNLPRYDALRLDNNVTLSLKYSFTNKKSYLVINNPNPFYNYVFKCNLFEIYLNATNLFSTEINSRFLDEYCILLNPIKDITLNIFDENNNLILNYFSKDNFNNTNQYSQLKLRQKNFIFQNVYDQNDTNQDNSNYIINLPFMDSTYKEYIYSNAGNQLIENFFTVTEDDDLIAPNINVTQSFYNTIDIDS